MIVINEYENTIGNNIIEFSCPYCCKPLQWSAVQKSPLNCYGCMEPIVDITHIIDEAGCRISYHIEGSNKVSCMSSKAS